VGRGPRTRSGPGSAAAGAAALPGAAPGTRPSTDGRPAGVSLSLDLSSPVVPVRLGGRCRVVGPVTGCPARCRPTPSRCPGRIRWHRPAPACRPLTRSQLGWLRAHRPVVPPRATPGEPDDRPSWLGGVHPAPDPLTSALPKRGAGPFSGGRTSRRWCPPDSNPRPRSALRSPVRESACSTRHTRSRGIFVCTGFSPELPGYTQRTPRIPPRVHRFTPRDGPRDGRRASSAATIACGEASTVR
jgi:hypothetical protein